MFRRTILFIRSRAVESEILGTLMFATVPVCGSETGASVSTSSPHISMTTLSLERQNKSERTHGCMCGVIHVANGVAIVLALLAGPPGLLANQTMARLPRLQPLPLLLTATRRAAAQILLPRLARRAPARALTLTVTVLTPSPLLLDPRDRRRVRRPPQIHLVLRVQMPSPPQLRLVHQLPSRPPGLMALLLVNRLLVALSPTLPRKKAKSRLPHEICEKSLSRSIIASSIRSSTRIVMGASGASHETPLTTLVRGGGRLPT